MAKIIEMPKLSDTMTSGVVVKWHKQVGDSVADGDILGEIETDKATMELENFEDGILLKLFVNEGEEADIGKPLAAIGAPGEEVEDLSNLVTSEESPPQTAEHSMQSNASEDLDSMPVSAFEKETSVSADEESKRILVSPLARKIAHDQGIDLTKVMGSGPMGRITKRDLESFPLPDSPATIVEKRPDESFSSNSRTNAFEEKRIPVSKMRSIIAKRLLQSKTNIPHFYLQKEINAEPLADARTSINKRLSRLAGEGPHPTKVSINDLILCACARAIPEVPEINASWAEEEIIQHGTVDLAFGVAVDDGLVTPVIRQAECKSLLDLSLCAKDLAARARAKKLTPDEMSGSTFTVTNLGMYGIDFFSGIINPPNAAILSVGASVRKPVLSDDGSLRAGVSMILGLSCDHRLVDGAVGARFLQVLAEVIESPAAMLI